MDAFVWDQHFVTGLADVDDQHHGLVTLFNNLSQALFTHHGCNQPDTESLLDSSFEWLVDYTKHHFADEEGLMHRVGVDARHIQAHETLHREFVSQLGTLWATRASMAAPAETFATFLTAWLSLHILGIDQSLARQIAAMEQGASAQEAYERELAAQDNGSTQVLLKMVAKLYHVLSAQNTALAQANLGLEERVAQRTRELAQANSELQQANVRLEAFGRTDGLLQIANRGYFDDRLAHATASAFRRQQPLGLLMIDVDEFKRYNDHFGHQAGAMPACRLSCTQCRASCSVPPTCWRATVVKSSSSSCPMPMPPAPAPWLRAWWPAWRRWHWRTRRPAPPLL